LIPTFLIHLDDLISIVKPGSKRGKCPESILPHHRNLARIGSPGLSNLLAGERPGAEARLRGVGQRWRDKTLRQKRQIRMICEDEVRWLRESHNGADGIRGFLESGYIAPWEEVHVPGVPPEQSRKRACVPAEGDEESEMGNTQATVFSVEVLLAPPPEASG
jgi:hypothetical protein